MSGFIDFITGNDDEGQRFPDPGPAAPPSRSDAEVQQAALDERRRRGAASGRESTIATSGQGVLTTDEHKSAAKTLLGES